MGKFCQECDSPIKGRIDKKFCSDDCRSSHHNRMRRDTNNFMRSVNSILRKNRRILFELYSRGETRIDRDRLLQEGFAFGYYTNEKKDSGKLQRYCYELGYVENDSQKYSLVRAI
ncbi:MAG: hypothetical protein EA409_10365 [Saprospirales bacterium]|nr:MAG: hypothetical protein EA409_10365 [Saprospirales bacterium]